MGLLKLIKNLLIIIILLGIVTAVLDYYRMVDGEVPIFCTSTFDKKNNIQLYNGIFYKAERVIKSSTSERLELSSNIKYKFLIKTIDIKIRAPKKHNNYILFVKKSLNCPRPSSLYYVLEDKKIFIDCIDDIMYKEDNSKKFIRLDEEIEKDPKIIDSIIDKASLVGTINNNVLKYITLDESFVNQKLYIYKCNSKIKDIYITMNPNFDSNYCTNR